MKRLTPCGTIKDGKMNHALARKIRRYTRKSWKEFFNDISSLPLHIRIGIAWHIITYKGKKLKGR